MKNSEPEFILQSIRNAFQRDMQLEGACEAALRAAQLVDVVLGSWTEFQELLVSCARGFHDGLAARRRIAPPEAWTLAQHALRMRYPSESGEGTVDAYLDFASDPQRFRQSVVSAVTLGLKDQHEIERGQEILISHLGGLTWAARLELAGVIRRRRLNGTRCPASFLPLEQIALRLEEVILTTEASFRFSETKV